MDKKPEVRVKIKGMRPSEPIKVPQHTDPLDVASIVHDSLQARTPVDTGRAQAGWKVRALKSGSFVVVNNVEYVQFLERGRQPKRGKKRRRRGHSKQAPKGMMRAAIADGRKFIAKNRE